MKSILYILFFTFSSFTFSQIKKTDLIGDWIKYKAERIDSSRIIDRGYSEQSSMKYYFSKDKFLLTDHKLDYSIVDKRLTIGTYLKYRIERLKNDTLILSEAYPNKRPNKLNRFYFYKAKKTKQINTSDTLIKMIDGIPLIYKIVSKDFSNKFTKHIFKKLLNQGGNTKFKGYIMIDIERKAINTVITEPYDSNKRTLKKIINAINSSFHLWSFSTKYKVIRVNFTGMTLYNEKMASAQFLFNSNSFDKILLNTNPKPYSFEKLQKAEEYFSKGNNDFQNKKYKSAIKNYTKSFNLDNLLIDAIYNRALTYLTIGDKEKACQDWQHLADLEQRDAMKYLKQYCQ